MDLAPVTFVTGVYFIAEKGCNMRKRNTERETKKYHLSLSSRVIFICFVLSIAVMSASVVTNYIELKENMTDIFDRYLQDTAHSAGDVCGLLYSSENGNTPDLKYKQYVESLKIEQLPSSYTYVVDPATTNMLYHPTAEKIG